MSLKPGSLRDNNDDYYPLPTPRDPEVYLIFLDRFPEEDKGKYIYYSSLNDIAETKFHREEVQIVRTKDINSYLKSARKAVPKRYGRTEAESVNFHYCLMPIETAILADDDQMGHGGFEIKINI